MPASEVPSLNVIQMESISGTNELLTSLERSFF